MKKIYSKAIEQLGIRQQHIIKKRLIILCTLVFRILNFQLLEPVFTAENGVWTELFQTDPRQKCSESTKDSSAFFLDGLENPSPIPHFQL